MDVTVSGVIKAPPEGVFDYMSDATRWPEWHMDMRHVERVSGPDAGGVGTVYRYTSKVGGLTIAGTLTVSAFEPGRRLAWEGEWAAGLKPRGEYRVDPVPGGALWTAHLTPQPRGAMRLMRPIVERQIRRFNEDALQNLRRRFEVRA
jgi:uncharacterized protein YndB with AHSA1/START domain